MNNLNDVRWKELRLSVRCIQAIVEADKLMIQMPRILRALDLVSGALSAESVEDLGHIFDRIEEYIDRYRPRGVSLSTPPKWVTDLAIANAEAMRLVTDLRQGFQTVARDSIEDEGDETSTVGTGRRVFIVHGHDESLKHQVARMLQRLKLQPVILAEQPNNGRTLIEKFEQHAEDVAFAIVLLTPDDVGGARDSSQRPRARQNVVLELGYFFARLGRAKVAALYVAGVELPSDIVGVVYTPVDAGWQFNLAKEMKAAGLDLSLDDL